MPAFYASWNTRHWKAVWIHRCCLTFSVSKTQNANCPLPFHFPVDYFFSVSRFAFFAWHRHTVVRHFTHTWLRLSVTRRNWSITEMWRRLESAQHTDMAKRRRWSTGNCFSCTRFRSAERIHDPKRCTHRFSVFFSSADTANRRWVSEFYANPSIRFRVV